MSFCPLVVEPGRFPDIITGCFSSLRALVRCSCLYTSSFSNNAWQTLTAISPFPLNWAEDSAGLRSCAPIHTSWQMLQIQMSWIVSRCKKNFQNAISGKLNFKCMDHACRSASFKFLYLEIVWPVIHQAPICQLLVWTMGGWKSHVAGVLLGIARAGMSGKCCTLRCNLLITRWFLTSTVAPGLSSGNQRFRCATCGFLWACQPSANEEKPAVFCNRPVHYLRLVLFGCHSKVQTLRGNVFQRIATPCICIALTSSCVSGSHSVTRLNCCSCVGDTESPSSCRTSRKAFTSILSRLASSVVCL